MKGKLHFWFAALVLLTAAAILTTGLLVQADGDSPANCPQGQGYWANHADAWKVNGLMLGTQFYSQAELLAILPGGGGDASTILVVQLVSTKLSIAAGTDGAPISAVMLQADALLAQFTGKFPYNVAPSSPAGQAMISLAELLDHYNSGQMTPNCAPTSTPSPTFTPSLTFTPTDTPTPGPSPTPTNTPTPGPSPTPTSTSTNPTAVTIIVEGPVQTINVNIITIYNININVDAHDTVLTHVHIGDFVRVEGNTVAGTTVLVVQAVNIFVVNVNTIVTNNNVIVWTDDGKNCSNPPPPWAPANGWRRRCENHPTTIITGGNGNNGGMGMGMGDDGD